MGRTGKSLSWRDGRVGNSCCRVWVSAVRPAGEEEEEGGGGGEPGRVEEGWRVGGGGWGCGRGWEGAAVEGRGGVRVRGAVADGTVAAEAGSEWADAAGWSTEREVRCVEAWCEERKLEWAAVCCAAVDVRGCGMDGCGGAASPVSSAEGDTNAPRPAAPAWWLWVWSERLSRAAPAAAIRSAAALALALAEGGGAEVGAKRAATGLPGPSPRLPGFACSAGDGTRAETTTAVGELQSTTFLLSRASLGRFAGRSAGDGAVKSHGGSSSPGENTSPSRRRATIASGLAVGGM